MTIANDINADLGGSWNGSGLSANRLARSDWAVARKIAFRTAIGIMLCWSVGAAHLVVTPYRYVSRWTLILPGSSQSATMHLETIGQATSTATSPFGSISLSPKVVYKEIADSDQVRVSAALSLGMTYKEFGRPRIKLIDETGLMQFEMGAGTPELAQKKALASIAALNAQLEVLRNDEIAKRAAAITQNLKGYQEAVDQARQKITDVQLRSGLVSINQFNELVASLASARRRQSDLAAELGRLEQEQVRLVSRVGVDSANATIALRMAADPALAKVISDYADASAMYTAENQRLGPGNPVLINIEKRRDAAREQLRALTARLGLGSEAEGRVVMLMTNVSRQAELFQQVVRNEALSEGKRRELEQITADKVRLEDEVARLSGAAASLEDLRKDHLLAEAVYSSALARVDTSKSDIYGAYPIVQVLAPPNLPEGHEQPRRLYALAGGLAGTLFSLMAGGLAWLHHRQTTRRRKKRSSIG
jgi:capsule polysaccharide export protein KpsE/RkpR